MNKNWSLCRLTLALLMGSSSTLLAQSETPNQVNSNSLVRQKEAPGKSPLLRTKEDSLHWREMREFIGDEKWYSEEERDSLIRRSRRADQPTVPRTLKDNEKHHEIIPQNLRKPNPSDTTSSNASGFEDLGLADIRPGSETVAEPMIAVNPLNAYNFVSVCFGGNPARAMASYTMNGGITWTNSDIPSYLNRYAVQNDPVVAYDASGTVYYSALDYQNAELDSHAVVVHRSTSSGQVWTDQYIVVDDQGTGSFLADKEWITCDQSNSTYRNSVYVSWTHFPGSILKTQIMLSYMRAGGTSFSTMIPVSSLQNYQSGNKVAVQGSHPVVAPDGSIYVFWLKMNDSTHVGSIYMNRSINGGLSFLGETEIITGIVDVKGQILGGTFQRAHSFPDVAVRKTGGTNFEIFVTWADKRSGTAQVYSSKYSGSSWSSPNPVYFSFYDQFSPAICVNDQGTVAVTYFERVSSSDSTIYVKVAESTDGGFSYRIFNEFDSFSGNLTFLGDYMGIAANAFTFWTADPGVHSTSPLENDIFGHFRLVEPVIQTDIPATSYVWYGGSSDTYKRLSPYLVSPGEVAGTSRFIKALRKVQNGNTTYTFSYWDDEGIPFSSDTATYIQVRSHSYTARYSATSFTPVSVKNEFKEPGGAISNGGIVNVDNVDKNTDPTGGKFDTTYLANSSHRFEAKDQQRGSYYRGFNPRSDHGGGWACPDSVRYLPVIFVPVKSGTYTARYRNRYNVTLAAATYFESGSGATYKVNGTNVGSTWSGNYWQYDTLRLEAVPPDPGWILLQWSDGSTANPRIVTDGALSVHAVFKKHLGSSNSGLAWANNERRITEDFDWVGPTYHAVYESGGAIWYLRNRRNAGWENEWDITAGSTTASDPSIMTYSWVHEDQIQVYVAWLEPGGTIMYRASNVDNGVTWQSPRSLPIGYDPSTPTLPDPYSLVWAEGPAGGAGIYYYKMPQTNDSWWPQLIPGTTGNVSLPAACATSDCRWWLAFIRDGKVYAEGYSDPNILDPYTAPTLCVSPTDLTTPGWTATNPSILNSSSGLLVAWEESTSTGHRIALRQKSGATWSAPLYFTHSTHTPRKPVLGSDYSCGTLYLMWQCSDHIALTSRPIAGGSWNSLVDLGPGRAPTIVALGSYKATAMWTSGTAAPYSINLSNTVLSTLSATVSGGWNMVSDAVFSADLKKTTVYPTATSNALTWNGTALVSATCLNNGTGYFLQFPSLQTVNYGGIFIPTLQVPVISGWNMIGSTSRRQLDRSILQNPGGIITTGLYTYNHGYVRSHYVDPGVGYWVKANASGTITLDSTIALGPNIPFVQDDYPPPLSTIASPILSAPSNGATSVSTTPTLYWNSVPGATSYHLQVSAVRDLTFPVFDQSGLTSTFQTISTQCGITYYWHVNSENSSGSGNWSTPIYSFTTVACPSGCGSSMSPIAGRLPVVDPNGGKNASATSIKDFRFEAYPNPFNAEIQFDYDLPDVGYVRLAVFDVLGRRVTSISEKEQPGGTYRVHWDGTNFSSGIYFARFEVFSKGGNSLFSRVTKLLLAK